MVHEVEQQGMYNRPSYRQLVLQNYTFRTCIRYQQIYESSSILYWPRIVFLNECMYLLCDNKCVSRSEAVEGVNPTKYNESQILQDNK